MRRLIPLAIFVLAIVSLLFSYQKPVESAERCDVVKSLCTGQADMLNELCKAQGGSTQQCLSDFINYYSSCMTNNECPAGY